MITRDDPGVLYFPEMTQNGSPFTYYFYSFLPSTSSVYISMIFNTYRSTVCGLVFDWCLVRLNWECRRDPPFVVVRLKSLCLRFRRLNSLTKLRSHEMVTSPTRSLGSIVWGSDSFRSETWHKNFWYTSTCMYILVSSYMCYLIHLSYRPDLKEVSRIFTTPNPTSGPE